MSSWQVLVAPAIGWLAAQALKYVLTLHKDGFQLRDFYSSGGFPSAHTTSTVALAAYIGAVEGWTSHIFGVAFLFAGIVMYDALGVRRAVGQHSILLRELGAEKKTDRRMRGLTTAFGHTPREVAGGAMLGLAIGLVLSFT